MTSWVIGNWKLNPIQMNHAVALASQIASACSSQRASHTGDAFDISEPTKVVLAPSLIHLAAVADTLSEHLASANSNLSKLSLASQDVSALHDANGAFTGDVSAAQLADCGVEWVIIGHSERREHHLEASEILMQKLQHCRKQGVAVIYCVGESEAQHQKGDTKRVLAEQLAPIMPLAADMLANDQLIIAYEPVWAIGTGKVPTTSEVQSIHEFIKSTLDTKSNLGNGVPVIYGGSVKPDNASAFAACSAVDGVLVGSAALNGDDFIQIIQAFNTTKNDKH